MPCLIHQYKTAKDGKELRLLIGSLSSLYLGYSQFDNQKGRHSKLINFSYMHWIKLCTFSFLWNYSLLRLQLILVVLYRLTLPRFFFFLLCNCTSFLATVFAQQLRPYFSFFWLIVLSFFLLKVSKKKCRVTVNDQGKTPTHTR